jgi:2-keto-4-pentenoate hydratase/2-oxohepta-3-ene-1,7-dioic acid hydratase in catechol pathway
VAQLSASETLYPGEVIGSGTVAGGSGAKQGLAIEPGDTVELEVEGIGVLTNRIVEP